MEEIRDKRFLRYRTSKKKFRDFFLKKIISPGIEVRLEILFHFPNDMKRKV